MLGKSFNEIFNSIKQRKAEITKLTDPTSENPLTNAQAKQQVGSMFSYVFGDNSMDEHTQKLIGDFGAFKDLMGETGMSADDLAKEIGNVDSRIVSYCKSNDVGKLSIAGFTRSIGQMTLSAKLGSAALKILSTAANMAIMFAITTAISLAAKALTDYFNRLENAKEDLEQTESDLESIKIIKDIYFDVFLLLFVLTLYTFKNHFCNYYNAIVS